MNKSGRPRGKQNARPSKQAIGNYYALLRSAADSGDINAAGWLVSIAEQKKEPRDERC